MELPPPPPPGGLTPPPGYVGYGEGSYGAFTPFARVRGLGKALSWLMIVVGLGQVGTVVTNLMVRGDAADFLAGRIDEDEFLSGYAPALIISGLASMATIAVAVLTMIWMYRMATNLDRFGRPGRTWAPGWAIGGWFLPPLLFVIPWFMLRELQKGSDPEVPAGSTEWKQRPVAPIVNIWWVLYGLLPTLMIPFGAGLMMSSGFSNEAEDVAERIEDQALWTTLGGILGIAAAVAWFLVVRQLTERHARMTSEG